MTKTVEQTDPAPTPPESGRLPSALLSLNADRGMFSSYAFLVDKKTRTLTVWKSDGDKIKPVESFAIDLGAHSGDKTAEGDLKTPEGIYFFQHSMDGKKLDYASYGEHIFTTDYPNLFDRLEKKTGRGIWLHAIPDSKSLQRGSHGCVVVRNKVIEGLAKFIELKRTPMIVVDQVEYLTEKDWREQQSTLKEWLEAWRVKKQNQSGHVEQINLNALQIFNQGKKIVLRFLESQKTASQDHVGTKILYALREEDGLMVVSENWQPL